MFSTVHISEIVLNPTCAGVSTFVLTMPAVVDVVADQVLADADHRVALKARHTAKRLNVLESSYHKRKPIVLGAPAICVVPQGNKVGTGDDEPLRTH